MKDIMHNDGVSRFMPLWESPRLEEVQKLEGFHCWYINGIKYVAQMYIQQTIRSYQDLQ